MGCICLHKQFSISFLTTIPLTSLAEIEKKKTVWKIFEDETKTWMEATKPIWNEAMTMMPKYRIFVLILSQIIVHHRLLFSVVAVVTTKKMTKIQDHHYDGNDRRYWIMINRIRELASLTFKLLIFFFWNVNPKWVNARKNNYWRVSWVFFFCFSSSVLTNVCPAQMKR